MRTHPSTIGAVACIFSTTLHAPGSPIRDDRDGPDMLFESFHGSVRICRNHGAWATETERWLVTSNYVAVECEVPVAPGADDVAHRSSVHSAFDTARSIEYRLPAEMVLVDPAKDTVSQRLRQLWSFRCYTKTLPGDEGSILDLIGETRSLPTQTFVDPIANIPYSVNCVNTPDRGEYVMFFSTGHDGPFLQHAFCIKNGGDLWHGMPLATGAVSRVYATFRSVVPIMGDAVSRAEGGRFVLTHHHPRGTKYHEVADVTSRAVLASNFPSLRIRDNAKVIVGDKSGPLPLVWRNGDAIPFIDDAAVRALDARCSNDDTSTALEGRKTAVDDVYCGIYCVYAAGRLLGDRTPFAQLVSERYVSSIKGSSLRDLAQACDDRSSFAHTRLGMTSCALRNAGAPAILHVKTNVYAPTPTHFVLFLGVENEQALILDPPFRLRRMPFYELESIWDGTTILVRNKGAPSLAALSLPVPSLAAILTLFASSAIAYVARRRQRQISAHLGLYVGVLLLIAGAIGAMISTFLVDRGSLNISAAAAFLETANAHLELASISQDDVEGMVRNNTSVMLVDARAADAFQEGHIPGARSWPVWMTDDALARELGPIARTTWIVTYCQSEGCDYARHLARRIVAMGHSNVRMLSGGLHGWSN